MGKPELLSPAGDRERLDMALAYGADAVYLAGNAYGMRAFAGNFGREGLAEAVKAAHAQGVRVHVTCNTLARNGEIAALPEYLEFLDGIGADAVIAAGVDVLSLCKRHAPHVQVHMSTQTGITNYEMARVWRELGASRVILARGPVSYTHLTAAAGYPGGRCGEGLAEKKKKPQDALDVRCTRGDGRL